MKKKAILALTLAGLVALQLPMVAMADTHHRHGYVEVAGDESQGNIAEGIYVSGSIACTTTGEVGSSTLNNNAIQANSGATVTADSAKNSSYASVTVSAANATVTVKGAVENTGAGTAIIATNGATVNAGSVTNTGARDQAHTVSADNATVNVSGAVTNNGNYYAIKATNGATVTAGSATNNSEYNTVFADNATVEVTGAVTHNDDGKAISAKNGATVTVGDVTTGHSGISVSGATVTAGNVTAKPKDAQTEKDSMSGVSVNGTDSKVNVGNIKVESSKDLAKGLGVDLSSAGNKAEVMTKDITVTGDDGTKGVRISTEAADTKATVLVDGNISSTKEGAEIVAKEGTVQFVTTGTISGDDFALVIQQDSKTENIEIVAYELKTSAGGNLIGKETNVEIKDGIYVTEATTEYDSLVNYIIKKADGSESNLTTFETTEKTITIDGVERKFDTAKAGTKITIKAADGYEVKAGELTVTKEADGSYSVIVPAGGGVTLEAVMAAVQQAQAAAAEAEEKKATVTGSEGSAVIGGQWNVGPGGYWTYRNNGIFKDTWGYITLANGKTGWFYFDKNGVMATGWKKINDKWYYFNEVNDGTQGMMLTNTTTPDGNKVGADGVWIQ